MRMLPYVVLGAGGRTGSIVAQYLLDAGERVRIVVRRPAGTCRLTAAGAEVVVADLVDSVALRQAFSHAAGAYVMSPQHYGRQDLYAVADRIADSVADAAEVAAVPRIVALSSIGAHHAQGTGWIGMNHRLEQRLGSMARPIAFLRAAYFMENWKPMIVSAMATGVLPSFLQPADRAIPMVATADIGHVGARLLLDGWNGRRIIDLGGPRRYSPADVAAAVATSIGRPVSVNTLAETEWPAALASAGMSAAALAGFIEMTRGINTGHVDVDPGGSAVQAGQVTLSAMVAALVAAAGR